MTKPDRIAEVQAQRIIGSNASYTLETRGNIPAQWADWEYDKISGVIGDDVFGVSHNFGQGPTFDYMCALPVEDDAIVPAGQVDLILPPGHCAVYVHNGHVSGLAGLFDAVLRGPGPGEGWIFTPNPQFEIYGEGFDPVAASGRVEIWLPVARMN